MQFFVRCLLWIMMAALPLQGSAAVFARCATPAPAAAHHCHEASPDMPAPQPDSKDVTSHGKCSTCASCCTAATAPPLSLVLPAPFPRAVRAAPATEPAIAAIFPAALERPPRAP